MNEYRSMLEFLSWKDFIAGWVSGVCSISVGYPFETIKVRQQVKLGCLHGTVSQQAALMMRKEGAGSFFRGLSYPLWTTGVLNSLYFGFYGNSLRMIEDTKGEKNYRNCCEYGPVYRGWHWDCYWSGCIGGAITTLVNTPIELAKTVCQAHSTTNHGQPTSPTLCLINLYKRKGIQGCYHGGTILFVRDVPTFGMYAVLYEHIACLLKQNNYLPDTSSTRTFYEALAGGLSGVISWLVAIPVDVIKSRFMSDSQNASCKYSSIVDCIHKTYKEEGLAVFHRGLGIALVRAFPVNLICFVAYEQTLKHL